MNRNKYKALFIPTPYFPTGVFGCQCLGREAKEEEAPRWLDSARHSGHGKRERKRDAGDAGLRIRD